MTGLAAAAASPGLPNLNTLVGALAALFALLGSVLGFLGQRKATHAKAAADDLKKDVAQVHILVNSKLTAWIDRAGQLTEALNAAKIDVPPSATTETDPESPPAVNPGSPAA